MNRPAILRIKKGFFNIVLVVVSFTISLVLVEGIVRLTFPIYDPSGHDDVAFYYNPDGTPLLVSNFKGRIWTNTGDFDVPLEINGYGLRDHKDLKRSTSNDIFVVGDSFAFGYGVREEKRFSDMLQKLINIPVFNISIPGNLNEYKLLINYARKHGANIQRLIVSICMENDLLNYETTQINKGPTNKLKLKFIKEFLIAHMATYNMFTTLVHHNYNLNRIASSLGLVVDTIDGMDKNKYNNAILNSSFCQLKEIIEGMDAVILIVPSRGLWVGNNVKTERKVHDVFVALLKHSNIPVVDMRPIFEASRNPLKYHFRQEGHWNELGHAEAAKALANHFYPNKSQGNFTN